MLEDDKNKTGSCQFPLLLEYQLLITTIKDIVDSYLQHYIDLDVLVLDNFGNEEVNKIVIESIIFPLLAARVRQKAHYYFSGSKHE